MNSTYDTPRRNRFRQLRQQGYTVEHARRLCGLHTGYEQPETIGCDHCAGRGCIWCDYEGEVTLLANDPTPAEIVERIEEVQGMREVNPPRAGYATRVKPVEIMETSAIFHGPHGQVRFR